MNYDEASQSTTRESYAQDLIRLARLMPSRQSLTLIANPAYSGLSQFSRRIESLLRRMRPLRSACSPAERTRLSCLFAAVVLILGSWLGGAAAQNTSAEPSLDVTLAQRTTQNGLGMVGGDKWYLNNVVSTSLDTPAALVKVPISETVPVRGTIFDIDGSPAQGAEVWAAGVFTTPPMRERTLTDVHGDFVLHLKPLTGDSEVWSLVAYKGKAGTEIPAKLDWMKQPNPKQPLLISAKLVERSTLRCRILEQESKKPVRDARLYLSDGRVFISGEEGQIVIGGLQQGSHSSIVVADGRLRRRVIFDNTLRSDVELNIYLERAGRVVGKIVDQDNQPVPNAWVSAQSSGSAMALDGRCVVADTEGRFVWDGVPFHQGLRSLDAGKIGYSSEELQHVTVSENAPTEIVFRLTKQTSSQLESSTKELREKSVPAKAVSLSRRDIVGTIVEPDGTPVEQALVRWGATQYEAVERELRSNPNGEFRLNDVPDRDGFLTVIAKGWAPKFQKVQQRQTLIEIQLEKGAMVGGQVVASDKPVSGVSITPVISSPDPSLCNPLWLSELRTRSDKDGRFRIDGLPSSGVRLDFLHGQLDELRNQSLATNQTDHIVRMQSRGAFRGRVVDTLGNPINDFRVMIDFPRRRVAGDRIAMGFGVEMMVFGSSYTDDQGRFAFGDEVSPGATYRVKVAAEGYANAINDRVITTTVDQLTESSEYEFQLSNSISLGMLLLDARNNQPISGASVTLIDEHPRRDYGAFSWGYDDIGERSQKSDKNGRIQFDRLAFGEATVAVIAPGYARQRFGWRNSEEEFTVRMVPEAIVTGSVKSVANLPLRDLSLTLTSIDEQRDGLRLKARDQGGFKLPSLQSGWYKITLMDERHTLGELDFFVDAGQQQELVFLVDPSSREAAVKQTLTTIVPLSREVEATVNGKSTSRLNFADGLARFKAEQHLSGRESLVDSITENQLRDAIHRAAIQGLQQALEKIEQSPLEATHYQNYVLPALQQLAAGDLWPLGTILQDHNALSPVADMNLWLSLPLPGANPSSTSIRLEIPR